MSLIHEALRRAREETVRRDAAARGIPLQPTRPTRERSRWLVLTVALLSLALLVSLLLVARLSSRLASGPASGERPTRVLARLPQPASAAGSPLAGAAAAGGSEPPTSRVPDSPAPRPAPTVPRAVADEAVLESRPDAGTVREPPTARADSPSSAAEKSAALEADAETAAESLAFVRRVDLDDGNAIELGGIAWSESGPFALLNGRVVGVGESVRGYRVVEIDPEQVVLGRRGRRLVLRLK